MSYAGRDFSVIRTWFESGRRRTVFGQETSVWRTKDAWNQRHLNLEWSLEHQKKGCRIPTGSAEWIQKVHERPHEKLKGRLAKRSAGRQGLALRRRRCRGRQWTLCNRRNGHESFMSRSYSGVGKFRAPNASVVDAQRGSASAESLRRFSTVHSGLRGEPWRGTKPKGASDYVTMATSRRG